MKRLAFYGSIAIAVVILAIAGWRGATWLLCTGEGARWALDSISRHTPVKVSARKIEGRLLDHLRLDDVHLVVETFEADLQSLEYHLRPLRLLSGMAAIEELTLAGVRLQDNSAAKKAPDLSWPRVSGIMSVVDVSIKKLHIDDISYFSPAQGLRLEKMSVDGSVLWRHSNLTISKFTVKTPYGTGRGEVEAGFYQPGLRFDLDFASPRQFSGMNNFSAQGRFKPGRRPEQLVGNVALAGFAARIKRLELAGDVGITSESFNLRNLRFTRSGNKDVIGGGGSVVLTAGEPHLAFKLFLKDVDLNPEIKVHTKIGGTISLDGTPSGYHGSFALENNKQGPQRADVTGAYRGSLRSLELDAITASILGGKVLGTAAIDWQHGFSLKGALHGKDINPANFSADWQGKINFDLSGDAKWENDGKPRGALRGRLRESRLHNQLLKGEVKARFGDGNINVEKFTLQGSGFTIKGSGPIAEKLAFRARIDDLGQLVPEGAGRLNFKGHVRYMNKHLSGSATGRGRKIRLGALSVASAALDGCLGSEKDSPLFFNVGLRDIGYKDLQLDSASFKVDGTILRHEIAASLKRKKVSMQASFGGGMTDWQWTGQVRSFSGRDEAGVWRLLKPTPVVVSSGKIVAGPLILTGDKEERLEIKGEYAKAPGGGLFSALWSGLNSKRFGFLLPADIKKEIKYSLLLSGKIDGKISPAGRISTTGQAALSAGVVKWRRKTNGVDLLLPAAELSWSSREMPDNHTSLSLAGRADAQGSVTMGGNPLLLRHGSFIFNGNEQGIGMSAKISPDSGGLLTADFSSEAPFAFSPPPNGQFKAHWADINSEFLRLFMPDNVRMKGLLTGDAKGNILPGGRFLLSGSTLLSPPVGAREGKISLSGKPGEKGAKLNEHNVNFSSVSLTCDWREKILKGSIAVSLVDHGRLQGSFGLPISASVPVSFDKKGPLQVSLNGKLKENGFLSFVFPGLIKESTGEIDADVTVEGSWENQKSRGRVKLTKAGAYIPSAGIDVRDVNISLALEDNLVRLESLQARSGPGEIHANGVIRGELDFHKIADWRVLGYEGTIGGSDFQLVYTPELQVRVAPKLTFSGTPDKLTLRGEVKIPELLVFGPPAGNFVSPSSDVVFEEKQKSEGKTFLPVFDARVRLTLGDRVLVKMKGIDARLAGGIDLEFQNIDSIASTGEIRVTEGNYKAYGVALRIVRGRLFYAGGNINQPALDILALRSLADVRAGVTIGGTLRAPVIKLYSEPVMSDVDILSCIVFGRPLSTGSSAEQIGVLAQAASLLLTRGKASGIQDTLKEKFGLSTLDIQSRNSGPVGSVGYKKINGGILPADTAAGNDVADTLVAVGKYLTPQLYLSYGRSLLTGNNIFSLRYDITKKWQLETVTGTESGADLYYKIDFK